jgi:hypothetical protein
MPAFMNYPYDKNVSYVNAFPSYFTNFTYTPELSYYLMRAELDTIYVTT